MSAVLPAVYLAAGEGRRLRPLTDDRPKALAEVGDATLGERALRTLRSAGVSEVVAVTGYKAEEFEGALGSLLNETRFNERFADAGNIYSLWCARDLVERGCYIVNSDVLFEEEIAHRLVVAEGSTLLCAASEGVDQESMKAVAYEGRLTQLSKTAPIDSHPEYIGLTRIDPVQGPSLAEILDGFVERNQTSHYYENAIEELARMEPVHVLSVDGLAWIEIDDHEDLERARGEVLERVTSADLAARESRGR
jgi:choline kinase